MKNIILLTTAGIFGTSFAFSACDRNVNTEDFITSENFIIHTDTNYPEITISNEDQSAAKEKQMRFSYALNGSTVELSIDDEIITTLDFNYAPPIENIVVADFDFDGYQDIFIPFESPVDSGSYYCYDPTSNSFAANSDLNAVGRILNITEDEILVSDLSDENTKRLIEYQWIGKKLKALKKTETYVSSESGNTITDIYTYDENGIERLSETLKGE